MPDAKPVRMWGVWDENTGTYAGAWMTDDDAKAFANGWASIGHKDVVIPGTFTPDEEGSDETDD